MVAKVIMFNEMGGAATFSQTLETAFKKEEAYRTNTAMEQALNNFVFKQVHFPFYFIGSLLLKKWYVLKQTHCTQRLKIR